MTIILWLIISFLLVLIFAWYKLNPRRSKFKLTESEMQELLDTVCR